jgi:hypothetical protein
MQILSSTVSRLSRSKSWIAVTFAPSTRIGPAARPLNRPRESSCMSVQSAARKSGCRDRHASTTGRVDPETITGMYPSASSDRTRPSTAWFVHSAACNSQ